eukprot:8583674-Alexandrium_andersonii.AAC.1
MELGEQVYQKISNFHPWRAARLTGMILGGSVAGIQACLDNPEVLARRVQAGLEAYDQAEREGWLASIPYYPPEDVRRIRADVAVRACDTPGGPLVPGDAVDE